MFVHHVFFWLKDGLSKADQEKFKAGITSLTTIDVIETANIGKPANTSRGVIDTSYSYSLLLIFENDKNEEIYQRHPIHLKFIEDCSALWEKVIVYDSVNII